MDKYFVHYFNYCDKNMNIHSIETLYNTINFIFATNTKYRNLQIET